MKHFKLIFSILILFVIVLANVPPITAQDGTAKTVGVISGSTEGYTLIFPTGSNTAFLVDGMGHIVNEWTLFENARDARLTERGTLVVNDDRVDYGNIGLSFGPPNANFAEYSWDGELLWSYEFDLGDDYQAHHGVEVMPNGHILFGSWERKSLEEAFAMGRNPADVGGSLWPDAFYEYDPIAGEIVWEWHAWDHMVQDFDPNLPNYGVISEHPNRININFYERGFAIEDWMHSNALDYNPELDQILISVREFNEVWIIDHSISSEEAAGPAGDLLYRWGNPRAYQRGTVEDRQLSFQHDAQWVPAGYPGAGNIIAFSNQHNSNSDLPNQAQPGPAETGFSKVVEFTPPLQDDGTYLLDGDQAYGPENLAWSYGEDPSDYDFFSAIRSGVQRLPNGNTLIIKSTDTVVLEVNQAGEVEWEYIPPFINFDRVVQGSTPNTALFRARQYPADFAGFEGRDLVAGLTIEDTASTTQAIPARLAANQAIQANLNSETPERFYTYSANFGEVIAIDAQPLNSDAELSLNFTNSDEVVVFEAADTDTPHYFVRTGHFAFSVTSDTPDVDYELTITRVSNIADNIPQGTPRLLYGTELTSFVIADDPTSDFAFAGAQGEKITISMERGANALEPVISLMDADQNVIVMESDEDENGLAIIEEFELPYSGLFFIHTAYDEASEAPIDANAGAYTLRLHIVE